MYFRAAERDQKDVSLARALAGSQLIRHSESAHVTQVTRHLGSIEPHSSQDHCHHEESKTQQLQLAHIGPHGQLTLLERLEVAPGDLILPRRRALSWRARCVLKRQPLHRSPLPEIAHVYLRFGAQILSAGWFQLVEARRSA